MKTLVQDIRFGFRTLFQKPSFTIAAILALGLAIGSSSAMFSVVNAVILKPLNFDDSENVVIIWESAPRLNFDTFTASPANFVDWRTQAKSFEYMAAYQRTQFTLTGVNDAAERVPGALVSSDYFNLMKTPAFIGRTLLPEEAAPGKDKVVVLSYGFWNRRLGSEREVVGRKLTLNGEPYNIVGVMPDHFMYPTNTELWTPTDINVNQGRGGHYLVAIGRLKAGVTIENANTEMKKISADLSRAYPDSNDGWTSKVINLHDDIISDVRQSLYILLGAVGFVLLIACANVANLLLARGTDRNKEIAVRTAMGASRGRIMRQLLTESVILAVAGGLLGIILAYVALSTFVSMAPPSLPRVQETVMDRTVLAFAVALSLMTGLAFGIIPAFQVSRTSLGESLKDATRGSSGGSERHRVRSLLVVSEIALTIIVLVGAGLMLQSLGKLAGVDVGFNPKNVLTAQFNLSRVRYGTPDAQRAFIDRVLERLSALPGVTNAATTSALPLGGGSMVITYKIAGRPVAPQDEPSAAIRFITPNFFKALQVPMVKGREFTEQDRETAPAVIIINEALARREFPNEDPLGKQMLIGYGNSDNDGQTPRTIIGVVKDMRIISVRGKPEPQYYLPYAQMTFSSLAVALRTANQPAALASALRNEMKNLDADIALFNVRPYEEVVAASIGQARFNASLLATFGGVALLLASVGVYGVMAYSVNQRTHEIGIRMALGQRRTSVLSMILRQTLTLTGIGLVIGIIGAFALTRLMETMLFNVDPTDPVTFLEVSLVLMVVAALAGYFPALRATRVDPMIALRYE